MTTMEMQKVGKADEQSVHESDLEGPDEEPGFEVGKAYICARTGAGQQAATIVKKRVENDVTEYYVHYIDKDRRLDEWITADRIGEEVSVPAQKIKRSARSMSVMSAGNLQEEEHGSSRARSDSDHHEMTKVRNINKIQLGKHEIDCWYYSPYPEEYGSCDKLYICERSFKYFGSKTGYENYVAKTKSLDPQTIGPPGTRIYHDPARSLCVYEVDGRENQLFGQNLCLFGKLFIEHKTLSFDPTPFYFYVLYEEDADGLHPVGYFSKEKRSKERYNLACIVTLPPYQRKGYGKFIISLSYEISKLNHEVGSPEKPLSDLGKLSYRSYWTFVLLDYIDHMTKEDLNTLTLDKIAFATGIKPEDILSTLQYLKMIYHLKGQFVIKINQDEVKDNIEGYRKRNFSRAFCKADLLTVEPKHKRQMKQSDNDEDDDDDDDDDAAAGTTSQS